MNVNTLYSFVGAGLAPALTEPQDLMINFEGDNETKPYLLMVNC